MPRHDVLSTTARGLVIVQAPAPPARAQARAGSEASLPVVGYLQSLGAK